MSRHASRSNGSPHGNGARPPAGPLALVTGAGGGIGRATVQRLLADGMRVIALDCSAELLDALARAAPQAGLHTCLFDLAQTGEIPGLIQQLVAAHGPITRLVNNAGIWEDHALSELADQVWDRTFRVNVKASFVLIRELAPVMAAAGGGAVVNVASRNAFRSSTGNAAYDASKGAQMSLTRTAAGELARHNIRVNALCPGIIRTPPNQQLADDPAFHAAYCKLIPMNRFGEPEEMAGVIAFLLSADAAFVTGQAIIADGGQIACQDNERFMEVTTLLLEPHLTPREEA